MLSALAQLNSIDKSVAFSLLKNCITSAQDQPSGSTSSCKYLMIAIRFCSVAIIFSNNHQDGKMSHVPRNWRRTFLGI